MGPQTRNKTDERGIVQTAGLPKNAGIFLDCRVGERFLIIMGARATVGWTYPGRSSVLIVRARFFAKKHEYNT